MKQQSQKTELSGKPSPWGQGEAKHSTQFSIKSPYLWITILFTSILIFFFYGKIILSPNDYLFKSYGDGFTAYYNTSWHIEFDESYTEFKGSNYPYGEHTIYSEYRLLISNSIKALGNIFPTIKKQNIAITNLSILGSILVCSIFLFLLLKKLNVRDWLCVTGAIGITFLSPQVGRFDNHLTLAYMCFLPITWYLIFLFFEEGKKIKWSIALLLNSTAWFFVHSYLGLIAVSFTLAFWLIFLLRKKELKISTNYLHLFIQVALPVFFFFSFVKMTDIHEGRTENPLGFLLYNSEPDDIFIPHHPPLRPLLDQFANIQLKWEGWAYVGILTTLSLLYLLFHFGKKIKEEKKIYPQINWLQHDHLKTAFPAALLLLIFAFGFPFKSFPQLLEWFPLLKNFRTTGRFGWVFYFVSTVSVIYFLNEILDKYNPTSKLVKTLLIILPLMYLIEGWAHHHEMSFKITATKNYFNQKNLSSDYLKAIDKIDSKNYQAIIPIPFYYCGSENFSIKLDDTSSRVSKIFSYHLQLPLMAFDVGRTSIPESKKIVQILSPTYYKKLIEDDLSSDQPFLLVVHPTQPTTYQQNIIDRADLVFDSREIQLYRLSKAQLLKYEPADFISEFQSLTDSTYQNGTIIAPDSSFFFYENFENKKSENVLLGNGAYEGDKRGRNTLTIFPKNTFQSSTTYTLSFWIFNGQADALNDWFRIVVEEETETGEKKILATAFPEFTEVIDGDWSFVELDFSIPNTNHPIHITTIGKPLTAPIKIYVDELLVREKGKAVFHGHQLENGIWRVMKNGHYTYFGL